MNDESSLYKVSSTFAPTEDFKIGWMNSSAVLLYATGYITLTLSIKKSRLTFVLYLKNAFRIVFKLFGLLSDMKTFENFLIKIPLKDLPRKTF